MRPFRYIRRTLRTLRSLLAVLPLAAALPALATVPLGYVSITGSNVVDSTGVPEASGTIYFAPVSNSGAAISYRIGGIGQALQSPVSAQVVNGAFTIQVADTMLTAPVNVCFSVTIVDNVSGNSILGPGYGCVQPAGSGTAVTGANAWCTAAGVSGGTCNFDTYTPNLAALIQTQYGPAPVMLAGTATPLSTGAPPTVSLAGANPYTLNLGIPAGAVGPTGPVGPAGPVANWRGAWAATTAYAKNDGYTNGSNSYVVITAYTSGGTFGSTDTSNTIVLSASGGVGAGNKLHLGYYAVSGGTLSDLNQYAQNSVALPTTAVNTRIPSATLPATGWTASHAHGSSFTSGTGASTCSTSGSSCYARLVAAYTGTGSTFTQFAVSGNQWCDVANEIFADENQGASSTVFQFMDGQPGYNDWQFGGGVGQQETVANLCAQATLAMITIPSTNKVVPSPATNWSTDTTTYGNATNPALVSTTLNAAQVFSYTLPASVVPQMVGIVYRLIDTVSSTQNYGSFKVVDSYDSSVYFANTYTFPKAGTHNNPTAGGTGILWLSVPSRIAAGTYTATVTVTSPTASTNVVAIAYLVIMPPAGGTNPVWITGMIQGQNAWNQSNILTYDNDLINSIALLQSYGDNGINFVEERNAVFSTAAEMGSGVAGLLHPGDSGHAAYAVAMESPTAQPQKLPTPTDPSTLPIVRNVAMTAAGDFLQCSDQIVTYSNASVAGNIVVPWCGTPAVTSGKEITLHNGTTTVSLPITAGPGATAGGTLAGGIQLAPGRSLTIYNIFSSSGNVQWFIEGGENDPSVDTSASITTTTYTMLCTDQSKFFSNTVVITLPTTCPVTPSAKHFKIKNTGSGTVTFSGATGDVSTLTLYHNQAVEMVQFTAGSWSIFAFSDANTKPSLAGVGTATFAVGAGAGTTPGTPVCATSHVCDSLGGIVSLTMGTATPTTGVALTVTTGITRTNQPDCEVKMWLQASPFTTVEVNATTSTTAIGFNLTGVAATASTAYFLRYGPCHGN